jgi:hypothetical protein
MTWHVGDIGAISPAMADRSSTPDHGRVRVTYVRAPDQFHRYCVDFIDEAGEIRPEGEHWYVCDLDLPDPVSRGTLELIDEPAGPVGSW